MRFLVTLLTYDEVTRLALVLIRGGAKVSVEVNDGDCFVNVDVALAEVLLKSPSAHIFV